jgi:hypothetical protein
VSSQSESPTVTVEHPVPRTLDAYEATDHFMDRLKYRTDPEPTKRIVSEALEHGIIKQTHIPNRYIFEDDRGLYTWWVVVRLVEAAFRDPNTNHDLLTVYVPDRHDSSHQTVFDARGDRQ